MSDGEEGEATSGLARKPSHSSWAASWPKTLGHWPLSLYATMLGQILTSVRSWWPRVTLLEGVQGRWEKSASQLPALPFSASAAARGGCAGALLSQPRSDVADPDRASLLWTEAALCTWALLGTWVIGCLFIFPKHPPVLLLEAWCAHTGSITASSCQELCWVSVQPLHSNSIVMAGKDRITQFPEEQVLQLKYAGLGCVSRAVGARLRAELGQGEQELYSTIFICGLWMCWMLRCHNSVLKTASFSEVLWFLINYFGTKLLLLPNMCCTHR